MAFDSAGDMFIADTDNNVIREVTPHGNIQTVLTPGFTLNQPQGVAVDASGDLFIADTGNDRVLEVMAGNDGTINSGGAVVTIAGSTQVEYPHGLAFDSSGDLFIADEDNYRVLEVVANGNPITSSSTIETVAGTGADGDTAAGQQATSTQLSYPTNVAVDSAGNLYIADYGNTRVLEVNAATQTVSTIDSGYHVEGLAVDSAGDLFIADGDAGTILEKPAGSSFVTTIAGTETNGYNGDGLSLGSQSERPGGSGGL